MKPKVFPGCLRHSHPLYTTALFAAVFVCFAIGSLHAEDASYTIRSGDTLEDVASAVYAALPDGEPAAADNRWRGVLIYRENRDALGLAIQFRGDDRLPFIPLPAGKILTIPVRASYPSPAALRSMLDHDVGQARRDLRLKNEAPVLRNAARGREHVEAMRFRKTSDGALLLNAVSYRPASYTLTDGALIPRSSLYPDDWFVWRIVENGAAEKTIFLFPCLYDGVRRTASAYNVMSGLEEANHQRPALVLLEGLDQTTDARLIDSLTALQKRDGAGDAAGLCGVPDPTAPAGTTRPAVIPSLSLFYTHKRITIRGVENETALKAYRARRDRLDAAVAEAFREFRRSVQKEFLEYYSLRTELFLRRAEEDILRSASARALDDPDTINAVNGLQREFAKLFAHDEFFGTKLSSQSDASILAPLDQIDILCGSSTASRYRDYAADIRREWEKDTNGELEKTLLAFRGEKAREINRAWLETRDGYIAETFSSLPAASIGIAELNVAHVENQILQCLKRKDYNLVIYYHPNLDATGTQWPPPPDPVVHGRLLERFRPPADVRRAMVLPPDYNPPGEDDAFLAALWDSYRLLASTEPPADEPAGTTGDQIILLIGSVKDEGTLARLIFDGNGETTASRYVFIPGRTDAERTVQLRRLLTAGDLTAFEQSVLERGFYSLLASENL